MIQQLRCLEEHGLVERELYLHEPHRVDFLITPLGMRLQPWTVQLYAWGLHHAQQRDGVGSLVLCDAAAARACGQENAEKGTGRT